MTLETLIGRRIRIIFNSPLSHTGQKDLPIIVSSDFAGYQEVDGILELNFKGFLTLQEPVPNLAITLFPAFMDIFREKNISFCIEKDIKRAVGCSKKALKFSPIGSIFEYHREIEKLEMKIRGTLL